MTKNNFKLVLLVLIIISTSLILFFYFFRNKAQANEKTSSFFIEVDKEWTDTTLKSLSLEQKISQLIIYKLGNITYKSNDSILTNLRTIMPGGVSFKTDSLKNYIKFQNLISENLKINLFYLLNSNKNILQFEDFKNNPDFFSLLSIKNDSLIEKYIKTIVSINKNLNVSINILPKFLNAQNDSLYNKKYIFLNKTFNKELYNNNIINCLPYYNLFTNDSLKQHFNKTIFDSGLMSIIYNNKVANLQIKNNLNFKGFNIIELQNNILSKDSIQKMFISGAELFITSKPEKLKLLIIELINENKLSEENINQTVRKILLGKTWLGIQKHIKIEQDSITKLIDETNIYNISNQIFKESITLVKNKKNIIPFTNINTKKFEIINIGTKELPFFNKTLKNYTNFKSFNFNIKDKDFIKNLTNHKKKSHLIISLNKSKLDSSIIKALLKNNNSKSITFINFGNIHNLNFSNSFNTIIQVYSNSEEEQKYTANALFGGIKISGQLPTNINNSLPFGTGYETKKIRISESLPENEGLNPDILIKIDSIAKNGIRNAAFPGCQIVVLKNGNSVYNKSFGYHTYSKGKAVKKSDLYDLASITKIAATTTAAMMLYDKGKIRLNNKLGKFFKDKKIDYSNIKPDTIIHQDTLFYKNITDFTKLLKTGDTIRLNDSIFVLSSTIISTLTPKNNIFNVKLEDILLHKSGISPVLPILPYVMYKKNFYDSLEIIKERFYKTLQKDTLKNDTTIKFNLKKELENSFKKYFSHKYIKDSSEIKIADNIFLKNNYLDTLWLDTKRLKVHSKKFYKYSDINMILLQMAIDSLNKKSIDKYLKYNIYKPMGLKTMCYKPLNYFSKNRIIPTEDEEYWRQQVLVGNVHDPSSAMLGQIAGNAGLFSNAFDLATLGQMWLNEGTYGGRRYIKKSTIKKFTGSQKDSHRGLGFNKPARKTIISNKAPKESYGHTGFTGTCIWIDPVNDIVFVFLSNRIHPNQKNWKINRLKIRQKIHTIIYDAIKN